MQEKSKTNWCCQISLRFLHLLNKKAGQNLSAYFLDKEMCWSLQKVDFFRVRDGDCYIYLPVQMGSYSLLSTWQNCVTCDVIFIVSNLNKQYEMLSSYQIPKLKYTSEPTIFFFLFACWMVSMMEPSQSENITSSHQVYNPQPTDIAWNSSFFVPIHPLTQTLFFPKTVSLDSFRK